MGDLRLGGHRTRRRRDRQCAGGVLFGSQTAPGLHFGAARGAGRDVDTSDGGTAWLAQYGPDGSIRFARTISGTAFGRVGELDRDGNRVSLDVTLRGPDNEIDGMP